jgi:hypothetical protein
MTHAVFRRKWCQGFHGAIGRGSVAGVHARRRERERAPHDPARRHRPGVSRVRRLGHRRLQDGQAVSLAEYAARALIAAEELRIKTKPVERISLEDVERADLVGLPGLNGTLRKKLAKKDADLTVAEVASMVLASAESLLEAEPKRQMALLLTARKLIDCL